uniref:Probable proton-coupled zinc antiporter SLC30A3 n=1 Tax=Sinocyclocheilus anshuiensis TaxID=1608454 RepID=A0A671SPA6_9TELE
MLHIFSLTLAAFRSVSSHCGFPLGHHPNIGPLDGIDQVVPQCLCRLFCPEVLGSLLSVLSIWTVTVVLVLFAVQRLISDDYEIHSDACAVTLNIFLAFILHQSPVHHSHSHGLTEEHRSTSVKAAFIHMLGDLLQRLGVLLAASIIYFRPEWKIADPICTFLFSLFVLGTTFTILKDIFKILMEGVPCGVDFDSVKDVLLSVSGVKSTHSLRMWSLTTSETQLSVHAVIGGLDFKTFLKCQSQDFPHASIQLYHVGESILCDE